MIENNNDQTSNETGWEANDWEEREQKRKKNYFHIFSRGFIFLFFVLIIVYYFESDEKPKKENCDMEMIDKNISYSGVLQYDINVKCQKNKKFKLHYGSLKFKEEYNFIFSTDSNGISSITLDLFLGWEDINIVFNKDLSFPLPLPDKKTYSELFNNNGSFKNISKASVVWVSPVNIDLHAYEFGSPHGEDNGHLWGNNKSNYQQAKQRGSGYISHVSNYNGKRYEVYTFIHHNNSEKGVVDLKVDFNSRGTTPSGEYCGDGKYATPYYKTIIIPANKKATENKVQFKKARCKYPLDIKTRYESIGFIGGLNT